jgi:hypothetical protein
MFADFLRSIDTVAPASHVVTVRRMFLSEKDRFSVRALGAENQKKRLHARK